jgi:hypothetical protein
MFLLFRKSHDSVLFEQSSRLNTDGATGRTFLCILAGDYLYLITKPRQLRALSQFLLSDPFVRSRIEQIERQRSAIQHLIVKSPNVEFAA